MFRAALKQRTRQAFELSHCRGWLRLLAFRLWAEKHASLQEKALHITPRTQATDRSATKIISMQAKICAVQLGMAAHVMIHREAWHSRAECSSG